MQLLHLSDVRQLRKLETPPRQLEKSFVWAHSNCEKARRLPRSERKLRWGNLKTRMSNLGCGERLTFAGFSSRWLP